MIRLLDITPGVRERYPGLVIGMMTISGFNPSNGRRLDEYLDSEIGKIKLKYPDYDRKTASLSEPVSHYVRYFKSFKKSYPVLHQLESLILKDQGIPKANPLFQAMFLSELNSLLLSAGHDLAQVSLPLTLDMGDGSDITYDLLFGREGRVAKGDLYLSDGEGVLTTILMGPDARTRITDSTTDVLYFVYGVPGVTEDCMNSHLESILRGLRVVMPELSADTMSVVKV